MAKIGKNIKGMSAEDLSKKEVALREELRVLRFKAEGGKSKNVKESKALRRQIAQVLTERNKNNKKK